MRSYQRSLSWLKVVLVLFCGMLVTVRAVGVDQAPKLSSAPDTNAPLYLLTYDHGGLVLWGTDHFAERLRNAVAWLDRYPGFKIGLDNEAYVYDYLAEKDPGLLDELRGYLKKYSGRLGIGSCTYGQPLSQFIDSESNLRQLAYALQTERTRLGCSPSLYLMSEHAMHSQMPQILDSLGFRGAIMRTHFMMYGYNPTFDIPIGWWTGLDGSRVAAVPTYPGEGAAFGRTPVDNWFLTRYPGTNAPLGPADFRKQFAHIQPLLATRADDSGLRKEELVRECEGNPAYRWVLLDELPGIFPTPSAEMRTAPNDFTVRMPWGYCGNEIWNLSRRAEVQVLTAERLAAMELLLGGTNREAELEPAWKNLLVGQHHDIQICGLLPDARKFLSASWSASTNVTTSSLQFVASRMKGEGLAQVTVFNPLSWSRCEWVEVGGPVLAGNSLAVKTDGKLVPSVLLNPNSTVGPASSPRLAFLAEMPPLSFVAYSLVTAPKTPKPEQTVEISRAALGIRTPFLEAQLASGGGMASLVDRRTGRPVVEPGKRSAFFAGRINGVDCESSGRWTLQAAGPEAPWATAVESGSIGGIPYAFEIRFHADSPRLDCRATFHFEEQKIGQLSENRKEAGSPFLHEHKLRFKLFPAVGPNPLGVRDLPFAVSATTNHYVEGLYWTALVGPDNGVALFNRGTMGAVRESDGGFSLPLAYVMYYIWGTRMLKGDFVYEFAVQPFAGDWTQADLHRQAMAYNFPLVFTSGPPGTGALGETVQPLTVSSEQVLVSALYPQKNRVLLRLFEYQGRNAETEVTCRVKTPGIFLTDALGTAQKPASNPIAFHPWQFRTFAIRKQP